MNCLYIKLTQRHFSTIDIFKKLNCYFLFNLPGIYAQALSMQASSKADWAFLSYIAKQYSSGRDIVFIQDQDYERSIWAQSELKGVNLTGQLGLGNNGHISEVERSFDFGHINPNSIVVVTPVLYTDKNKLDISALKVDKKFDFTRQGTPYVLLSYIQTIAKTCNPFFRFLAEGGRKINLYLDYGDALTLADDDINENWEIYREKFLRGDIP